MKTTRAKLRERLAERLVPVLLRDGFVGPSTISGNKLVHEYRRQAPQGTQVLAIQFDKWQRPRFIINLHAEPPEGIEALMARGGEIVTARLKPRRCPYTRCWFRADPPWWRQLLQRNARTLESKAVEECVRLFPEVEAWWAVQSESKHITCSTVKYQGSGNAS